MFYNPCEFEFTRQFTDQWRMIRIECDRLGPHVLDVHRIGTHEDYFMQTARNNGWSPSWKVGSTERNYDWLTYGLSHEGQFPDEAREKFPVTMALIQSSPCITAAAFSKMNPLTMIAPHVHPELGGNRLTFHLGIDVEPRRSYLGVDGLIEEEKNNKPLIFDGSVEHFAVNMSESSRTILYIEFDRSKL